MSDFQAKIKAVLDTDSIESKINEISNKQKLKLKLDLTTGNTNFDNVLKQLANQMKSSGNSAGETFAQSFNSSLNKIKINHNAIDGLEKSLNKLNFDDSSIKTITKDLGQMDVSISSISQKIKGNKLDLTVKGVDELGRAVTVIKQYDKASDSVETISTNITQSFKQTTSELTKQSKETQESFKEILSVAKQMNNLEFKIESLKLGGNNSNEISVLENQLESLKKTYGELIASFNMNDSNLNVGQFQKLTQVFDDVENKLDHLKAKLADKKVDLANGISDNLDSGKFSKSVTQIELGISKLSNASTELTSGLERVKLAFTDMNIANSTGNMDLLVTSYNKFESELKSVSNLLEETTKKQKAQADAQKLSFQRIELSNEIEIWIKNNSQLAEQFGNELRSLQAELKSCDGVSLKNIASEFKLIKQEAELTKQSTTSFFTELKDAVIDIAGFSTIYEGIQLLKEGIETGVETVVGLDSALVDLQKTTTATASELNNFYFEANEMAKELGTTTQDAIQTTSDWSRMGLSLQDSITMGSNSSILYSISPEMSNIEQATDSLISTTKAYGIEAQDTLDGIVSKVNSVGNAYGVTNNDVMEGLQQSASAMVAANNTLDENIALIVAGQEITQDANRVGNALKTISMRIRGYDEETEEYVGDVEKLTGQIADLTQTASNNFAGVSIFTDDTKTTYKSTYKVLEEIATIWDELTDKNQAELLEVLFGKNRANVGAAILQNFESAQNAMNTMADSAGSAEQEMENIYSSLEYKINALKETGTGIWQNLFAREDISVVIELLTKLAEVIDFVTEKLGLFGTIGAGAGIFAFIKNLD